VLHLRTVFQKSVVFVPPEQPSKKISFNRFSFQFINKISLLPEFFPSLIIAIFCIRTYRSYRTFNIDKFNNDIDQIKMENLDSVTSAEQVNETYQKYDCCLNFSQV
jgi:hypothetical protein